MTADWFEALTGFKERTYEDTRRRLEVVHGRLRSRINSRSYGIGVLETPSLAELRARAAPLATRIPGRLRVGIVVADAARLHRDPANRHAAFQVASQFNLLEMAGPRITPEHGVTRYMHDRTQGPACAIAAGAAAIYRNYFAPVGGGLGQTCDRQIDCLHDVGAALGNRDNALWTMRNGYAMCSDEGLSAIERTLSGLDEAGRDTLRGRLRLGVHWDVEVTGTDRSDLMVSQVLCSALPASYTSVAVERWTSFATLVLEAAYEATLWAAVVNVERRSSNVVYLTQLGGGAFGNRTAWIHAAIRRAIGRFRDLSLDVRIVSRRQPDPELVRLVRVSG
jgi:hypothetical protein